MSSMTTGSPPVSMTPLLTRSSIAVRNQPAPSWSSMSNPEVMRKVCMVPTFPARVRAADDQAVPPTLRIPLQPGDPPAAHSHDPRVRPL